MDLSFKTFWNFYKKATKREKNEKNKPWVTKSIIKSIKAKEKL